MILCLKFHKIIKKINIFLFNILIFFKYLLNYNYTLFYHLIRNRKCNFICYYVFLINVKTLTVKTILLYESIFKSIESIKT